MPLDKSPLDPADWDEFRSQAHRLLDACIDHLANVRMHPWQPVPEAARQHYALDTAEDGKPIDILIDELVSNVLPYSTGNIHPRFFGWVHGTGLASSLLADIVASTMNSNCGGRDHGAVYVEREVIDWCRRCFGFPEGSSGVLVTGTSQATVIALAAARTHALGPQSRRNGIQDMPKLTAYAAEGVHNAIVKACELIGIGAEALRRIPCGPGGAMHLDSLAEAVARDRREGYQPFCVVGTAGSVNLGEFDDLAALADFCAEHGLWFHVDGAFGAWSRLADPPWNALANGIDRADSLAFDFHKWMYVQYDCGAVLVRDETAHRAAFAARPAYLEGQDKGAGGGEPWFCDYGIDLSRGFRALKVWSALRAHGTQAFARAITRNCELAALMAARIEADPGLRLVRPVRLNVCCFNAAPADWDGEAQDALNATVAKNLQLRGEAVFSTTRIDGRTVLRAAIVNHRSSASDIEESVSLAAREADRLARS
ncbi:MAG TPA: pyridoxal-dependent decarboxylase [Woeseiaceae bacterium]|nr:pyridoxal-dependent decarboxylase [Woeseiaceae bacterium]